MENTYITITHINDYAGYEVFRPGMELTLKKDTNNAYDDEAIAVYGPHGGKYGYVGNSVHYVCRGTHSAGYVYESVGEDTPCRVCFVAEDFVIALLGAAS